MANLPWETDDVDRNWEAYFQPGTDVLRNRVHARSHVELQYAENDLSEVRLLELRENPDLLDRTYDLTHFAAIHRQLFQDVYEWAGHLRTVGIEKGESFCPQGNIDRGMIETCGSREGAPSRMMICTRTGF